MGLPLGLASWPCFAGGLGLRTGLRIELCTDLRIQLRIWLRILRIQLRIQLRIWLRIVLRIQQRVDPRIQVGRLVPPRGQTPSRGLLQSGVDWQTWRDTVPGGVGAASTALARRYRTLAPSRAQYKSSLVPGLSHCCNGASIRAVDWDPPCLVMTEKWSSAT